MSAAGGEQHEREGKASHHGIVGAAVRIAAASTGSGVRLKSLANAATVLARTSSGSVADGARHAPPAASSSSRSTLVLTTSWMPHGTMRSKYDRSVVTFRAKPCQVTHWRACTPMDAILRFST